MSQKSGARKTRKQKIKVEKNSKTRVKKLDDSVFKQYRSLSPFELKTKLIALAKQDGKPILNAGRGNPNFYNSFIREVFSKLQQDLVLKGEQKYPAINIWPQENEFNYTKLLKDCIKSWKKPYRKFMESYIEYLIKKTKTINEYSVNFILHDFVLSTIGAFYPSPPRIQPHLGIAAREFLYNLVTANGKLKFVNNLRIDDFDCFPTEGAAAAILYIFNTFKENFLLRRNAKIALITPIFSPYLELPDDPLLSHLKIIRLKGNPEKNYSLDDSEMDKLKDKGIKALFMVNPANPSAYSLSKQNINYIANIVNTSRKDLIILEDNVYAPFTDEYNSFIIKCPYNTIEVYSLSKYFGTTGWRLGVCLLSKKNIFNSMIQKLPDKDKKLLNKRYHIASLKPETITFIDRLVLDSRQIAEGHVAGLSTPQQVLMGLFFYYQIYNGKYENNNYNKNIKKILSNRLELFYDQINTEPVIAPTGTNYYNLLDIPEIAKNIYGEEAQNYLLKNYEYVEFLFHLASQYQTVLLPGAGFGSVDWKVRICFANLDEDSYRKIGINVKKAIGDMVRGHKGFLYV